MDMHEHRRERLKDLISKPPYNGERKAFAEAVGISLSRLSQMLSPSFREGKGFGEKMARKLEEILRLPNLYFDLDYLVDDSLDDAARIKSGRRIFRHAPTDKDRSFTVPFNINAGPFSKIEVRQEAMFSLFGNAAFVNSISVAYAKDDSMAPTISSGDLVFFDMAHGEATEDGIYIFVYGGPYVHIKRLQRAGSMLRVICDNDMFSSWEIDLSIPNTEKDKSEIFAVLGKVVKVFSIAIKTPT
ncbi:S24 family peptidase [Herbaspirillum seropedicae]|uniref:S24 family peptidase n=1 Tax=Herbaspirillum seropedicae TaxID=964 RepID=UPI001120723A|nr:S24 family peptidase [Herbaspirillum seropedicae]QDD65563.1 S24 family peptidase [Herbaspirillum seropedicae]